MRPDDLLARLAATLRGEIGPAVVDPFAKTQAFMAAVILERLGRQLGLAESQAKASSRPRRPRRRPRPKSRGVPAPQGQRSPPSGCAPAMAGLWAP